MASTPFVHLHLHSQYSLLDGAIKLDPLFQRARALDMPAVALTDHGNLFGAVEFYEKAREAGVKPIVGCEVYVASGSRFEKEKRERDASGFDAINHLLLLAMNQTGYRNLMYLVSKGYLEGFYYRPRIDLDLLRSRSEGLIATSGCLSSIVSRAITGGQTQTAWSLVEEFASIFDGRYYLELQRHGIGDQDVVNAELVKMSVDMNLPLVATNDCHYLDQPDYKHHDALLCIGTATNLDDPNRFRLDGQGFYVKSGDEMAGSDPGRRRHRIVAVGLGGPGRVKAEGLGMADPIEINANLRPKGQGARCELHGGLLFLVAHGKSLWGSSEIDDGIAVQRCRDFRAFSANSFAAFSSLIMLFSLNGTSMPRRQAGRSLIASSHRRRFGNPSTETPDHL